MTYRQGEIILASDYNTFQASLLNVYDVGNGDAGYGQVDTGGQAAVPTVAVGEIIKNVEWERFRSAAEDCSTHQGSVTFFPPASELAVGELVEAHEFDDLNAFDIDNSLAIITSNRLFFDAGSVTVFANALNSTRNTAWMNQLQHRFTATFPTVDDARYFFNSGGQIRFRGSRSGGTSSGQNDSWTTMFLNMGTIRFNYTETQHPSGSPGVTVFPIGYYDLTGSFQLICRVIPASGGYGYVGGYGTGVNEITIEARTVDGPSGPNADNGRQLEFRVLYTDGHTNPFFDMVDGTITSDIDYQKATSPLVIQTPVFASSIVLTAGT